GGGRLLGGRQVDVGAAVRGGQPLGLAAEPAQPLAGGAGTGLQQLDEGLGPGGGGLARRAVGALRAVEQLGSARPHLGAEPVEGGAGGAFVALGTGLLGAQVGADGRLLVQAGGGAVGLAQRGQRRGAGSAVSG